MCLCMSLGMNHNMRLWTRCWASQGIRKKTRHVTRASPLRSPKAFQRRYRRVITAWMKLLAADYHFIQGPDPVKKRNMASAIRVSRALPTLIVLAQLRRMIRPALSTWTLPWSLWLRLACSRLTTLFCLCPFAFCL